MWKLDCDRVKKVVCAFRSHADPGLQAAWGVSKSLFFGGLLFNDFVAILGYPLGYHFGEKSVKVRR